MAIQPNEQIAMLTMLESFKKQVIHGLYEELLKEIKPKLMEAAKAAAEGLKPQIQAKHDLYADQLVVHLIVKGGDESNNRGK